MPDSLTLKRNVVFQKTIAASNQRLSFDQNKKLKKSRQCENYEQSSCNHEVSKFVDSKFYKFPKISDGKENTMKEHNGVDEFPTLKATLVRA